MLSPKFSAKEDSCGALPNKHDSCGGAISDLLDKGVSKQQIFESLTSQRTDLIFTAHPTEVNRRTILAHTELIQRYLSDADAARNSDSTSSYQKKKIDDGLRRQINSIWLSDEVARTKPSVQSEAERGTLVVEAVLWDAVPSFLSKLDATMREELGEDYGLPLDASPITFGSWMGGDRDGNPNVTPDITREVSLKNRIKAATLLLEDIVSLSNALSITIASKSLTDTLAEPVREPYREFLAPIIKKLERTIEYHRASLSALRSDSKTPYDYSDADSHDDIYLRTNCLMESLLKMHDSLTSTNNEVIADDKLKAVIRNLAAFGLTLIPLDVRQESTRHTEAIDSITRYLGIGSYKEWDEDAKASWLQQELQNKRPLIAKGCWNKAENSSFFNDNVRDVLETFQMIAEQGTGSLGAYVISQATTPSDVMAVLLLQRDAGVKETLRIVPLFETLDDLNGAQATMEALWKTPAYVGSISGKQEVMVGYSDSAKDAGRLAASWAQYETQVCLSESARKHGISLSFFHGKGGTVGRGGNPATFHAILGHPPDTICGNFRVTEQGEMIHQNFGHKQIAERTLDIYTSALLVEKHTKRETPNSDWRKLMDKLSSISVDAYRRIVREDDR